MMMRSMAAAQIGQQDPPTAQDHAADSIAKDLAKDDRKHGLNAVAR
jgi:hypothetical protein